jgi:hypothetical protein
MKCEGNQWQDDGITAVESFITLDPSQIKCFYLFFKYFLLKMLLLILAFLPSVPLL